MTKLIRRKGRRPTKREYERMRQELPYGCWVERGTGCLVLFNRAYRPLWRRTRDGVTTRVTSGRWHADRIWIDKVGEIWFFNDGNPPWYDAETRKHCEWLLHRVFDVPEEGAPIVKGGA